MAEGDLVGFNMFEESFPGSERVNAQGERLSARETVDSMLAAPSAPRSEIGGEAHTEPAGDCSRCLSDILIYGETFVDFTVMLHLDVPEARARLAEDADPEEES
jgi:hypothetical protein